MNVMERLSPGMLAALVVLAGFVIGGVLIAMDLVLVGIVVALAAVPAGLVAWVLGGDRY